MVNERGNVYSRGMKPSPTINMNLTANTQQEYPTIDCHFVSAHK